MPMSPMEPPVPERFPVPSPDRFGDGCAIGDPGIGELGTDSTRSMPVPGRSRPPRIGSILLWDKSELWCERKPNMLLAFFYRTGFIGSGDKGCISWFKGSSGWEPRYGPIGEENYINTRVGLLPGLCLGTFRPCDNRQPAPFKVCRLAHIAQPGPPAVISRTTARKDVLIRTGGKNQSCRRCLARIAAKGVPIRAASPQPVLLLVPCTNPRGRKGACHALPTHPVLLSCYRTWREALGTEHSLGYDSG